MDGETIFIVIFALLIMGVLVYIRNKWELFTGQRKSADDREFDRLLKEGRKQPQEKDDENNL